MTSRPLRPSRPAAARASARRRLALAASPLAIAAALAVVQPAEAGPRGAQVKRGSAEITTRGNLTEIRQGGSKVVIDWQSFDIDADEAVRFIQPNRDATALNRILDAAPTHIRGRLEANGNVWIINRHGVLFHSTSVVNVGGLLASTADITNDDFMAGRYRFGIPGAPGARVVNEGEISFADAGLVALIGPHAANRGVIRGRLGKVVVGGAETYAVDLAGDGLFAFELDEAATGVSAEQAGEIVAAGGVVEVSAAAADALVDNVVSVAGLIDVSDAAGAGGRIAVTAPGGAATVTGELRATGGGAGAGGRVEVAAADVAVPAGARVDVSGATGGTALLLGEATLAFGGTALAFGTAGDGGFIDTSAPAIKVTGAGLTGAGGTWLIDPTDVTIGAAGDVDPAGLIAQIQGGGTATVTTPAAGGDAGNITVLDGLNDITVGAGVTGGLTLTAINQIIFDAASGGIAQNGADTGVLNVTLSTADANAGITQNGQALSLGAGSTLTLNGGAARFLPTFTATNLEVNAARNVTVSASGPGVDLIDAAVVEGLLEAGGRVAISAAAGGGEDGNVRIVSGLDDLDVTGAATLSLTAANNVTLANPGGAIAQTGGAGSLSVAIEAANVNINGATEIVVLAGGAVSLSGGAIGADLGRITTPSLALNAAGDATVGAGGGNTFVTGDFLPLIAAGTDVALGASGFLQVVDGLDAVAVGDGQAAAFALSAVGQLRLEDGSGGIVQAGGAGNGGALALSLTGASFDFDFTGGATPEPITVGADGSVAIASTAAVELTGITAPALTVTSDAGVTQAAGTALVVTGLADVTAGGAGDATLANAGNAFGTIAVDAAGDAVSIRDTDGDLVLRNVVGDTVTINAAGGVDQVDGATLAATTSLDVTAGGAVDLDNTQNTVGTFTASAAGQAVEITDGASGLVLGPVTAGALTVIAAGDVTQTAAATVSGAMQVTAETTAGAAANVTLDQAANAFGSVGAEALGTGGTRGAVTLVEGSAVALRRTTAQTLTVTAGAVNGGAITQAGAAAGDRIAVTGTATLTSAGTGAVTLANPTNDFGVVDVEGTPGSVSLADVNAIDLAALATTTLTVSAGGLVTDSGALTATTATVSGGGGVTLDAPGTDFDTFATASAGQAVVLVDPDAVRLGAVAAGSLSVTATGTIDQTGAPITVTGLTSLTTNAAGDVLLDDPTGNDFGALEVAAAGRIVRIDDDNALELRALSADTLTVTAGGNVTDTAPMSVTNAVRVSADGGAGGAASVTLDAADGDATDGHAFGGAVTISAIGAADARGAVVLVETGDISLGGVTSGALTVAVAEGATGAITQTGDVDARGAVTLTARGAAQDVTLDRAGNDFDGPVTVTLDAGRNVTLSDRDALVLGEIAAQGAAAATLTVNSGTDGVVNGGITQAAGTGIFADVADLTLREANTGGTAAITLGEATNRVATLSVDAAEGTLLYRDADALALGNLRASDAAILAGGAVTQVAAATITGPGGTGDVDLEVTAINGGAGQTVTLANIGNDFGTLSLLGGVVEVADVDGVDLRRTRASVSLTVTAGGDVGLDTVAALDEAGVGVGPFVVRTTGVGARITGNDLVGGAAEFDAPAALTLVAFDFASMDLSGLGAGADLTLSNGTGFVGIPLPVGDLTLRRVTLPGAPDPFVLSAAGTVVLDDLNFPGALEVTSTGGSISFGRVSVGGNLTATALDGTNGTITQTTAAPAPTTQITVVDMAPPAPVALPAAPGDNRPSAPRTLTTTGAAAGTLLRVGGIAHLRAGVEVDLDAFVAPAGGTPGLENDFTSIVFGEAVTRFALRDGNALEVGNTTVSGAGGTLDLTAGAAAAGSITQTAATRLVAPNLVVSTLTAGSDVTLANDGAGPADGNDFDTLATADRDFDAADTSPHVDGTLTIEDEDGLTLRDVSAANLTLRLNEDDTAGPDAVLAQQAGTFVTVTGATTLLADAIALDNAPADFGAATERGNALGTVTAETDDRDADGVRGALSLREIGGGAYATVTGGAVTLDLDRGDAVLGNVTADALTVRARRGGLSQTAATAVIVANAATLVADSEGAGAFDVDLDQAGNDFVGDVTGSATRDLTLRDANALTVAGFAAGRNLTARSVAGSVAVNGGTATTGSILAEAPNGFASVTGSNAGGAITANAGGDATVATSGAGGAISAVAGNDARVEASTAATSILADGVSDATVTVSVATAGDMTAEATTGAASVIGDGRDTGAQEAGGSIVARALGAGDALVQDARAAAAVSASSAAGDAAAVGARAAAGSVSASGGVGATAVGAAASVDVSATAGTGAAGVSASEAGGAILATAPNGAATITASTAGGAATATAGTDAAITGSTAGADMTAEATGGTATITGDGAGAATALEAGGALVARALGAGAAEVTGARATGDLTASSASGAATVTGAAAGGALRAEAGTDAAVSGSEAGATLTADADGAASVATSTAAGDLTATARGGDASVSAADSTGGAILADASAAASVATATAAGAITATAGGDATISASAAGADARATAAAGAALIEGSTAAGDMSATAAGDGDATVIGDADPTRREAGGVAEAIAQGAGAALLRNVQAGDALSAGSAGGTATIRGAAAGLSAAGTSAAAVGELGATVDRTTAGTQIVANAGGGDAVVTGATAGTGGIAALASGAARITGSSAGGGLSAVAGGDAEVVGDGRDTGVVEAGGDVVASSSGAGLAAVRDLRARGVISVLSNAGDAEAARVRAGGGDVTLAAGRDATAEGAIAATDLSIVAARAATVRNATARGTAANSGDVVVIADGDVQVTAVTAARDLTVLSGGAVISVGDVDLDANGGLIDDADGPARVTAGRDVTLAGGDATRVLLDGVAAARDFGLVTGGDVAGDAISAGGTRDRSRGTGAALWRSLEGIDPGGVAFDVNAGGDVDLRGVSAPNAPVMIRGADGGLQAGGDVRLRGVESGGRFVHVGGRGDVAVTGLSLALAATEDAPRGLGLPGATQQETPENGFEGVAVSRLDETGALLNVFVGDPGGAGDLTVGSATALGLRADPGSRLGAVAVTMTGATPEARTLEVFDAFATLAAPAGDVAILGAHDVTFGRNADGAFMLDLDLADGALDADVFHARSLTLVAVDGAALLQRTDDVNQAFLSSTEYYGLNLPGAPFLDYSGSPDLVGLDLAGFLDSRRRSAGLAPDRGGFGVDPDNRFNLCVVGDVSDCGTDPAPQAQVDPPRIEPPDLFDLDITGLSDVYGAFGNEELWAAPPAFTADIDDEEEETR